MPIINAHENINLTDSWGEWRRVWGLMKKDGTYIIADVMAGGGKWYLRYFRCGVVSFDCFLFSGGVRWVMCMDRSVREGVCSRANILKFIIALS